MPVVIEDRPIEAVREEVIDQLIMNYSHGKLSFEAFERRLDCAMASQDNKEIAALAEDLELDVDQDFVESKRKDFHANVSPSNFQEIDYLVNIFGGSDRSGYWTVAKEIRSISIFGGSTIDFSEAKFSQLETTIKVLCLFGGDDIYVPENVNVVSKAFCIFGGVNNKAPSIADRNAPTIIIEGVCIFGGLNIKLKRTIKEKFVAFADSMKKMFN
ncbi:LiaF domain-containing protein [Thalassotalea sp. G2M2-11]|uniref:LiaF domain-containing protein n=1 Tax=Thalassotalea sp. G2M2-11 TaxID=2787627 RepID=UPI0019D12F99|nr:LiaF domain-containing protein [Thalassotalea sp. G2M2-11]